MALISLRQMLDHAAEQDYGVPAFNVNNLEQMRAIMLAADQTGSPVIVQASAGARKYAGTIFAAPDSRRYRRVAAYPGVHAPGSRHYPGNLPALDPAGL